MMFKGLYDCFKHWYHGGSIFLYSDPHFGDEEMKHLRKNYIGDDEQVKRINSVCHKNDTLIILGDVGNVEYIKKLKAGYKVLIMGNHDSGASNYKRMRTKISDSYCTCSKCGNVVKPDLMDYYNCGDNAAYCHNCNSTEDIIYHDDKYDDNHLFDEVYEGILMIAPDKILSHEPVNLPFAVNFHGHDHANWEKALMGINLCAEWIDYTPVRLDYFIKSGVFKSVPDIHRVTIDKAIERKAKRVAK